MEEDEDEHYTSIRGRLLMLVNKIKGQSHKAEEPTEKEQAAPCEQTTSFITVELMLCYVVAVVQALKGLFLSTTCFFYRWKNVFQ